MRKNILFILILSLWGTAFFVACDDHKETRTIDYNNYLGYRNDTIRHDIIESIRSGKFNYCITNAKESDIFILANEILDNENPKIGGEDIRNKEYNKGKFDWIKKTNYWELTLKPDDGSLYKVTFEFYQKL